MHAFCKATVVRFPEPLIPSNTAVNRKIVIYPLNLIPSSNHPEKSNLQEAN